jgi:hypothetical protein
LLEECVEEMKEMVPIMSAGSATQQALEKMRQTGSTSLEDLQQFMADAGATVLVRDKNGFRKVEPKKSK